MTLEQLFIRNIVFNGLFDENKSVHRFKEKHANNSILKYKFQSAENDSNLQTSSYFLMKKVKRVDHAAPLQHLTLLHHLKTFFLVF